MPRAIPGVINVTIASDGVNELVQVMSDDLQGINVVLMAQQINLRDVRQSTRQAAQEGAAPSTGGLPTIA